MGFHNRLKELREAASLTQGELAERADMSKGGIANLEQGIRKPAWETLVKLAQALGVDYAAFGADDSAAGEAKKRDRGRPRKPKQEAPVAPKRPRGRPRKAQE